MEIHTNTTTTQQHASDLQQLTAPTVTAIITGEELEALKSQGNSVTAHAAFDILLSKLSSQEIYLRHQAAEQLSERNLSVLNIYQLHALTEVLVQAGDAVNIASILLDIGTRAAYDSQQFFDLFQGSAIHLAKQLVELNLHSVDQITIREQCINALLREEIAGLDLSVQQQLLTQPNDTKSLLKVLQHLPDDEAAILLQDIHLLASSNNALQAELSELWDNAIANSSEHARIDLCRRLLATQDGDIQSTLRAVLESSEDLETLVRIVHAIGIDNLPNNKEVNELTAIAYFYPSLRSSLCQGYLDQESSIQEVETSIQRLYSLYRSILEEHPEDGLYGATDTARDIRAMATRSLSVLDTRKALLEQQFAELQEQAANGVLDEAVTKDLLLNFYNTHLKIAELQLSFGVSISYGVTTPLDFYVDPEATSVPDWTLEELQSLETSLNAIPEGHLLFSPLLFEIQKVKYLDPGVLAARYYDGVIKVVQSAGKSDELAKHYPTVDALSFVLTHEIGHGIQIGDCNLDYEKLDPNTIDAGEQRYSFDDYVELSNWEVISPERWQLIKPWSRYDRYKVILDDQLYLVGEPIEHDGRKIILQLRGEEILLACSAESEFASRWYAKASPWEDFAEAFAEYIHCPERLIECAPQKFLFIEEEFRKYQHDRALLDLAEKRVKESSTHK